MTDLFTGLVIGVVVGGLAVWGWRQKEGNVRKSADAETEGMKAQREKVEAQKKAGREKILAYLEPLKKGH